MRKHKLSFCKILVYLGLTTISTAFSCGVVGQVRLGKPTAHSHNDYEQTRPFVHAFEKGFGSIEADIHWVGGKNYVGHDASDVRSGRTLATLYLDPLDSVLRRSKGKIQGEKKKKLVLLIDIKTAAGPTLDGLVRELEAYPAITKNKNIIIAISGNRPAPKDYINYPDFIHFDGRPGEVYDAAALKKVALISDSYYKYAKWNGSGTIPVAERDALKAVMEKAHALGKPFRFWASPDTEDCWKLFMEMGADFINTDKIDGLSAFIRSK